MKNVKCNHCFHNSCINGISGPCYHEEGECKRGKFQVCCLCSIVFPGHIQEVI